MNNFQRAAPSVTLRKVALWLVFGLGVFSFVLFEFFFVLVFFFKYQDPNEDTILTRK